MYVLFWSLLAFAIAPRARRWRLALAILIATCAIELLQLWQPPLLESIRGTRPGRLVLGTTFSLRDFPGYFLGALAAGVLGGRLGRAAGDRGSSPPGGAPGPVAPVPKEPARP